MIKVVDESYEGSNGHFFFWVELKRKLISYAEFCLLYYPSFLSRMVLDLKSQFQSKLGMLLCVELELKMYYKLGFKRQ